jgi:hypothetical protein
MIFAPLSIQTVSADAARLRRWIIICLISVAFHLLALNWAEGNITWFAPQQSDPTVIRAQLRPIQSPPAVSAQGVTPPIKPIVAKRKPRPRPIAPVAIASTQPTVQPTNQEAVPQSVSDAAEAVPEEVVETATINKDPSTDKTNTAQQNSRYKINPPPSAELKYNVQALREGQTVYGSGKIGWQFNGRNYAINGEAGVLFFTVLTFGSEGDTDDFGIAPLLYSEKRLRKSATNTHFNRDRNLISFSASTTSYQRQGGEQDRASIIWQLAGIGRGDQEKFAPNTQIPVFVAGVRDGETWHIHVIGEEDIEVGTGKVRAWHLVRAPRPGTYDQKLEIWLAPQQEWYPVRLRYTDANGDYLDMSLSSINPTTPR